MYKIKEQNDSLLTPIEMQIESFHKFARNMAAAGALSIVLESLEEARLVLNRAKLDPQFSADNKALILETKKEVREAEDAILQLAEYYEQMGFCA